MDETRPTEVGRGHYLAVVGKNPHVVQMRIGDLLEFAPNCISNKVEDVSWCQEGSLKTRNHKIGKLKNATRILLRKHLPVNEWQFVIEIKFVRHDGLLFHLLAAPLQNWFLLEMRTDLL